MELSHVLPLLTAQEIHRLEDRINTVVTLLQYAAPLLGGIALLYIGLWARISKALKQLNERTEVIEHQTNGPITDIAHQVQEVHSATVNTGDSGTGNPPSQSGATK